VASATPVLRMERSEVVAGGEGAHMAMTRDGVRERMAI
jgi:hypothetical protein